MSELPPPTEFTKTDLPDINSLDSAATKPSILNWKSWPQWRKYLLLSVVIIVIGVVGYGYYLYASTANRLINSEEETSLFEQLGLIFGDDTPLLGEEEDRINVLLLGIGGEGHSGGTLTDSIMVASIKPSTNEVSLLSLPRDLIIKIYFDERPYPYEGRKINNAYDLGGIELAKNTVSEVTGLDMHYYVLVDFNGFKQVIDAIGGIEVPVEKTFTGYYGAQELSEPCPQNKLTILSDGPYCAINFTEGVETMDGEQALIYSRIRKLTPSSDNQDQGTDFARAARQQTILESARSKLLSAKTFLRPDRLQNVLHSAGDHLETDMELYELVRFAELAENINTENIVSLVVDASEGGLLIEEYVASTGAYVLVPRAGDYNYSEIEAVANQVFETVETVQEEATVQVLNGTYYTGLAGKASELLETYSITVANIGNAPSQTESNTVIYDLTNNGKVNTVSTIQSAVGGTVASESKQEALFELDPSFDYFDPTVDFIIILGEDAITPIES